MDLAVFLYGKASQQVYAHAVNAEFKEMLCTEIRIGFRRAQFAHAQQDFLCAGDISRLHEKINVVEILHDTPQAEHQRCADCPANAAFVECAGDAGKDKIFLVHEIPFQINR